MSTREQDDTPVSRAVVGHVGGGEEAVVVAGVAGVEQAGEGVFVMAQVTVDEIDTQIEENQGEGDGQPFQWLDLPGGGPEQADAEQAVAENETSVEPRVVAGVDAGAVGGAESLGGVSHWERSVSFLLGMSVVGIGASILSP